MKTKAFLSSRIFLLFLVLIIFVLLFSWQEINRNRRLASKNLLNPINEKFIDETASNVAEKIIQWQRKQALIPEENIWSAVKHGDISKLKAYLNRSIDINQRDEIGNTLLMYASKFGHVDVASHLISAGAFVNTVGRRDNTALTLASARGHYSVIKLLLDSGADVNKTTVDGKNALFAGIKSQNAQVVKILLDNGASASSAPKGILPTGMTPLMFASLRENIDIVNLLLSRGIDVDSASEDGKTALFYAAEVKRYGVMNSLIKSGADVNHKDTKGRSILHFLIQTADLELITWLLDNNFSLADKDNSGFGVLDRLAVAGNVKAVEAVIHHFNSQDIQNALLLSVKNGVIDTSLLLLNKLDVPPENTQLLSDLLDVALQFNHPKIASNLESAIASIEK